MLNFDEQRFLRIQSGAVSLAGDIHETVGRLLAQGATNLFFLGSGGAGILMLPRRTVAPDALDVPRVRRDARRDRRHGIGPPR